MFLLFIGPEMTDSRINAELDNCTVGNDHTVYDTVVIIDGI